MEMLLMLFLIGCIYVAVSVLSAKKSTPGSHKYTVFMNADSQDNHGEGMDPVREEGSSESRGRYPKRIGGRLPTNSRLLPGDKQLELPGQASRTQGQPILPKTEHPTTVDKARMRSHSKRAHSRRWLKKG